VGRPVPALVAGADSRAVAVGLRPAVEPVLQARGDGKPKT